MAALVGLGTLLGLGWVHFEDAPLVEDIQVLVLFVVGPAGFFLLLGWVVAGFRQSKSN